MLVLLPPSETKAVGGDQPPLTLDSLSFPVLTDTRAMVLDALTAVSENPDLARTLLGVPASKDAEIKANTMLRTGPTRPAVQRYTGVLYDALDVRSMTRVQRAKAAARLAIGSAVFGMVRADDRIPAYRFSAGSTLPGLPSPAALWRPMLPTALAAALGDELVVDLRSGAYAAFGGVPGAVTVDVLTEQPNGQRTVVSHFNKHTKGLLARALTITRAEVTDVRGVMRVARAAGLAVQRSGPTSISILTT